MTIAEPRIAIVGAGPAGIYAADILLGRVPHASIDLFEKLPTIRASARSPTRCTMCS